MKQNNQDVETVDQVNSSSLISITPSALTTQSDSQNPTDAEMKNNMVLYQDNEDGFELLVPKTIASEVYSTETAIGTNNKEYHPLSYEYGVIEVPVKVIKDVENNNTYIAPEYTRYCDNEGNCNNVENTLDILRTKWEYNYLPGVIRIFHPQNIEEAEKDIQEIYNDEFCQYFIDKENPIIDVDIDRGIYTINYYATILKEDGPLGCIKPSYAYKYYNPDKKILMIMQYGVEPYFWYADDSGKIIYSFYDQFMMNSFKFY